MIYTLFGELQHRAYKPIQSSSSTKILHNALIPWHMETTRLHTETTSNL